MRLFVDVIGVEGGQAGRTSWTRQGQAALEATQGQMDGFFSQLSYKCHLEEVASVGDLLKICPQLESRVGYLAHKKQLPPRTLL